eukprot:12364704-Prorocentrum_lima.AAC.1
MAQCMGLEISIPATPTRQETSPTLAIVLPEPETDRIIITAQSNIQDQLLREIEQALAHMTEQQRAEAWSTEIVQPGRMPEMRDTNTTDLVLHEITKPSSLDGQEWDQTAQALQNLQSDS